MKFLFVHQNFPAQFLHIVRNLVDEKAHEIVFITEPNRNRIGGVRILPYAKPAPPPRNAHWVSREFEEQTRRAETVARAALTLRALGFTPDIIIGHHGWGEMLNLPDVWPDAPMLGYLEFFYRVLGSDVNFDPEFPTDPLEFPRVRAKNAVNMIALDLGERDSVRGLTPTAWQLSTYPSWARPRIELLREGVDLDALRPDPSARQKKLLVGGMTIGPEHSLLTYVARDLEPYRGFHILMRALPKLLRARPDLRCVLVGGDGVSYGSQLPAGSWRERMLTEVGKEIDLSRVVFPGKVDYELYKALLRRSDVHVYLTYPFVASWSLREALASGCVVIGSDTSPVAEFVTDGRTGLLAPMLDPSALSDRVLEALENKRLAAKLRAGARAYAERNLDIRDTITGYRMLIDRMTGGALTAATAAPRKKRAPEAKPPGGGVIRARAAAARPRSRG